MTEWAIQCLYVYTLMNVCINILFCHLFSYQIALTSSIFISQTKFKCELCPNGSNAWKFIENSFTFNSSYCNVVAVWLINVIFHDNKIGIHQCIWCNLRKQQFMKYLLLQAYNLNNEHNQTIYFFEHFWWINVGKWKTYFWYVNRWIHFLVDFNTNKSTYTLKILEVEIIYFA